MTTNKVFNAVMKDNTLFKDQSERCYASTTKNGIQQIFEIGGKNFENWLRILYREICNKLPNNADIQNIVQGLEAQTNYAGETYPLFNRVAKQGEAFWYYIANDDCQAIEITPAGWSLRKEEIPLLFKKSDLFLPQVTPVTIGGDYKQLMDFINIADKELQLLFLVCVASLIIPHIHYPACIFYGNEGSAKTTTISMIRKLIDPCKARPSVMSKNVDEMVLQLSKNHLVAYDNLDTLSKQQSDILCQAITGGSLEKRKLYTNGQTFLLNFQGALLLNGISNVVNRPDLLDRSVLFELQRIDGANYKGENELWDKFNSALPVILGGLFDVISSAMKIYPTLNINNLSRLGEFTKWGCAIVKAMGYEQDDFLSAYENNRKIASKRAVADDPLAQSISLLTEEHAEWTGFVEHLYKELVDLMSIHHISSNGFPKGSNKLIAAIKRCEVVLKSQGIEVIYGSKGNKGRMVTIRKTT